MSSNVTRRSVLATGAIGMPVVLAACANSSDLGDLSNSSGNKAPGGSASASPTPTPTPAAVTISSGHDLNSLQPGDTLKFTVTNGSLADVTVTDSDGETYAGTLSGDTWTPKLTWPLNKSFTVKASLTNADSRAAAVPAVTRTIRTVNGDANTVYVLYDGASVGVGMPVIIKFAHEVVDPKMRAAIEKAMTVDVSPAQEGAWGWLDQSQLMWRPKDFWKAGTKVTVQGALRGLPTSNHRWITHDVKGSFSVGDARILKVHIDSHEMEVYRNGSLLKTLPITTGKSGYTTRSGTKVIIERDTVKRMDSSTVGIPKGSSNYYNITVKWAMRVTYTGEFIHAAPWSEGSQGVSNVSHGCVGLSTANARWLFSLCAAGDPVINTGSSRHFKPGEGIGCWCYDWAGWQKLSAL